MSSGPPDEETVGTVITILGVLRYTCIHQWSRKCTEKLIHRVSGTQATSLAEPENIIRRN